MAATITAAEIRSPSSDKAYRWHAKPNGYDKRCSLCGYPSKLRGEHRAVSADEASNAKWIRIIRHQDGSFVHLEVGAPKKLKPRAPTGPTKKTLQTISRAAAMLADGATMRAIAAELKIAENTLYEFKSKYPELWRSAVERAMSAMAAVVEAQAGSVEILADPAAYVAKAQAAERWAQQMGRSFMPVKAGTLRAFYESYYRTACMGSVCVREAEMFERTIGVWAVLTGDPPLQSITGETLATFRDCIAKLPGKRRTAHAKPATVFAYMVHIQRILDKAGPPMKGNRDAAGILDRVPYIKPPRIYLAEAKTVSDVILNQLYLGLVAAEKPSGFWFKPSAWWRALIVLALNTGLRRGALFKIEMAHVDWQNRRIVIPAANNKSRKPFGVHLNETAYRHLWMIRSERKLLFPLPHNIRWFHTYFHRLQDAAGIPRADHFGLHNLRKTLATKLYEHGSPGAAQLALGHSAVSTTERHYVASSGIVANALDALPQPTAFAAPMAESEVVA